MAYNLPAPYAISVKDEPFFAKGDGVADDTAAFIAAFAAKDARGGGIIRIPVGRYKITSQVNVGKKPFQLLGEGFGINNSGPVDDAIWTTTGTVIGSVLLCTGGGGLLFNSDIVDSAYIFYSYKDFAIIGPGTGPNSVGLTLIDPGPEATIARIDNVGIFNFSTGLLISNFEDVIMHEPIVWGNTIGLVLTNVTTDIRMYDLSADGNSTGVLIADGAGIHFIGGLIQSNTTYGINIVPDGYAGSSGGAIQSITLQNLWMENNTSAAIHFDSTSNAIENVEINNCRFSVASLAFTGGNTVGMHVGAGSYFILGGTLTIPANVLGWWDAATTGQNVVNNSDFFYFRDRPGQISSDVDFTSSSSGFQIAWEGSINPNVVSQMIINITATNGSDAAAWTEIPITVTTDGSGNVTYLGSVSGEITPSAFTSGASGWIIDITTAGSIPHIPLILVAGPSAANWRVRVRGDSHS